MPQRYSLFSLIGNAFSHHEKWEPAWRQPEPKAAYEVIIVGGGGHGLATAYYLAKEHGIRDIAVVERGWIGGGNTGRNTTIVRSNYLWDQSALLYEHALKLWESLSQELNYNVMFSPRGVMNLAHNQHDLRELSRRINANRLNGVDSEFLTPEQVKEFCPVIDLRAKGRYPVLGASLQRRGGVARHDAVAWGYARGADRLGVDIIQNCPVEGFEIEDGKVVGVRTAKGPIRAKKVGLVPAGHSSVLAEMAGFRLPVISLPLQALVSEPVKPCFPCVVMSNAVHAYISQSDKGELVIGAGVDHYIGYGQRGSIMVGEETAGGDLRALPDVPAHADAAVLGRHRRHLPRRLADHLEDADREPVHQLRLGHRRLQGDARLRPRLRPHHRQGRAAPAERGFPARPLRLRLPDRRTRCRRGGALTCC